MLIRCTFRSWLQNRLWRRLFSFAYFKANLNDSKKIVASGAATALGYSMQQVGLSGYVQFDSNPHFSGKLEKWKAEFLAKKHSTGFSHTIQTQTFTCPIQRSALVDSHLWRGSWLDANKLSGELPQAMVTGDCVNGSMRSNSGFSVGWWGNVR